MKRPPGGGLLNWNTCALLKFEATNKKCARMLTTESRDRLTAIDSMRGIAILMVIAGHSAGWIAPASPWLQQITALGPRGVQLFYVMSAFSLYLSYAQRKAHDGFSLSSYFVRRLARIAPMFWLAIILHLAASGMGPRYWAPDGVSWRDVLLTTTFLNGWEPTTINSVVPGGWSVAVETSFYLVLPVFFVLVRSMSSALLATLACMVATTVLGTWYFNAHVGAFPEAQRYLPYSFAWELWLPSQLPVFMLGIVLYFAREKLRTSHAGMGILWLSMAVLLLAIAPLAPAESFVSNHFVCAVGFVFLALAMLNGEARFLDNRLFNSIGKISFSAYLLHFLVLKALDIIARKAGVDLSPSDLSYAIGLVLVIAISASFSALTYRLVELPGIWLGGRISKLLATTRQSPEKMTQSPRR